MAAHATLNPTWLLDLEFKDVPPQLEKEICFRIMLGTPPSPTAEVDDHTSAATAECIPPFRIGERDEDICHTPGYVGMIQLIAYYLPILGDADGTNPGRIEGENGIVIAEFHIDINHLWCLPSHEKLSNLSHLPSNALLMATMEGGEGLLLPDVLYQDLLVRAFLPTSIIDGKEGTNVASNLILASPHLTYLPHTGKARGRK